MKKIIFLTLVMILGISSVSFGKSYLCISDVGTIFKSRNEVWDTDKLAGNRYILKTNQNGDIYHFGFFGEDLSFCPRSEVIDNDQNTRSFKYFKTCRTTYREVGNTNTEVVFNSKNLKFQVYISGRYISKTIKKGTGGLLEIGKCSEI